jgi:hypothetical protein
MITNDRLPSLPTLDELDDSPEMSILVALEHTLALAMAALIAANPELASADELYGCGTPQLPHVWIADTLIDHANALRVALRHYRLALDAWRQRREDDRNNLPF